MLTAFIQHTGDSLKRPSKNQKAKMKKPKYDNDQAVNIEMNQHVSVPCSLKYLVSFSKRAANKGGPGVHSQKLELLRHTLEGHQ